MILNHAMRHVHPIQHYEHVTPWSIWIDLVNHNGHQGGKVIRIKWRSTPHKRVHPASYIHIIKYPENLSNTMGSPYFYPSNKLPLSLLFPSPFYTLFFFSFYDKTCPLCKKKKNPHDTDKRHTTTNKKSINVNKCRPCSYTFCFIGVWYYRLLYLWIILLQKEKRMKRGKENDINASFRSISFL